MRTLVARRRTYGLTSLAVDLLDHPAMLAHQLRTERTRVTGDDDDATSTDTQEQYMKTNNRTKLDKKRELKANYSYSSQIC